MKHNKRSKLGSRGKIGLTILIAAMFIGVASAAVLTHYNTITVKANVKQSVVVDGKDITQPINQPVFDAVGGETRCFAHWIKNRAPIDATVEFVTSYDPSLEGTEITTTYLKGMKGDTVSVTSIDMSGYSTEEDKFNAEPETLVLDDMPFDAQTDPVTIEGKISSLNLGTGWPNTAYVEIGVRPEGTKDDRNAGVYMIFFSAAANYEVHLQDYTGQRPTGQIITVGKGMGPYEYKITLTPNPSIGGKATLELWDNEETYYGPVSLNYGYASTWEENVHGLLNEDFTEAHLFYSIIADRRGVAGETYDATVGNIKTNSELPTEITILAGARLDFYICYEFAININPDSNPDTPNTMNPYTIITEIKPVIIP